MDVAAHSARPAIYLGRHRPSIEAIFRLLRGAASVRQTQQPSLLPPRPPPSLLLHHNEDHKDTKASCTSSKYPPLIAAFMRIYCLSELSILTSLSYTAYPSFFASNLCRPLRCWHCKAASHSHPMMSFLVYSTASRNGAGLEATSTTGLAYSTALTLSSRMYAAITSFPRSR